MLWEASKNIGVSIAKFLLRYLGFALYATDDRLHQRHVFGKWSITDDQWEMAVFCLCFTVHNNLSGWFSFTVLFAPFLVTFYVWGKGENINLKQPAEFQSGLLWGQNIHFFTCRKSFLHVNHWKCKSSDPLQVQKSKKFTFRKYAISNYKLF